MAQTLSVSPGVAPFVFEGPLYDVFGIEGATLWNLPRDGEAARAWSRDPQWSIKTRRVLTHVTNPAHILTLSEWQCWMSVWRSHHPTDQIYVIMPSSATTLAQEWILRPGLMWTRVREVFHWSDATLISAQGTVALIAHTRSVSLSAFYLWMRLVMWHQTHALDSDPFAWSGAIASQCWRDQAFWLTHPSEERRTALFDFLTERRPLNTANLQALAGLWSHWRTQHRVPSVVEVSWCLESQAEDVAGPCRATATARCVDPPALIGTWTDTWPIRTAYEADHATWQRMIWDEVAGVNDPAPSDAEHAKLLSPSASALPTAQWEWSVERLSGHCRYLMLTIGGAPPRLSTPRRFGREVLRRDIEKNPGWVSTLRDQIIASAESICADRGVSLPPTQVLRVGARSAMDALGLPWKAPAETAVVSELVPGGPPRFEEGIVLPARPLAVVEPVDHSPEELSVALRSSSITDAARTWLDGLAAQLHQQVAQRDFGPLPPPDVLQELAARLSAGPYRVLDPTSPRLLMGLMEDHVQSQVQDGVPLTTRVEFWLVQEGLQTDPPSEMALTVADQDALGVWLAPLQYSTLFRRGLWRQLGHPDISRFGRAWFLATHFKLAQPVTPPPLPVHWRTITHGALPRLQQVRVHFPRFAELVRSALVGKDAYVETPLFRWFWAYYWAPEQWRRLIPDTLRPVLDWVVPSATRPSVQWAMHPLDPIPPLTAPTPSAVSVLQASSDAPLETVSPTTMAALVDGLTAQSALSDFIAALDATQACLKASPQEAGAWLARWVTDSALRRRWDMALQVAGVDIPAFRSAVSS